MQRWSVEYIPQRTRGLTVAVRHYYPLPPSSAPDWHLQAMDGKGLAFAPAMASWRQLHGLIQQASSSVCSLQLLLGWACIVCAKHLK